MESITGPSCRKSSEEMDCVNSLAPSNDVKNIDKSESQVGTGEMDSTSSSKRSKSIKISAESEGRREALSQESPSSSKTGPLKRPLSAEAQNDEEAADRKWARKSAKTNESTRTSATLQKQQKEEKVIALKAQKDEERRNKEQLRQLEKERARLRREQEKREKDEKREAERREKEAQKQEEDRRKKIEKEAEQVRREQLRLQKEKEKLEREAQKHAEEEKRHRQKEAERLKKEELKREREAQRELERQQKQDEKEAKLREKEIQRKEKEQEELAKMRQQMKLADFFDSKAVQRPTSSRSNQSDAKEGDCSNKLNDYQAYFNPFFVKSNCNWYQPRKVDATSIDLIDRALDGKLFADIKSFRDLKLKCSSACPTFKALSVQSVMQQLQNVDEYAEKYLHLKLDDIALKFLRYGEDVRPPYRGTLTKCNPQKTRSLAKNPFRRDLQFVNYDYFSEAEWQDEEDGEDIDSSDEDDNSSMDEDGEESDRDFLDDDDDTKPNQRIFDQLIPQIKGLYWGQVTELDLSFRVMRMQSFVSDSPIDPFYNYWSPKQQQVGQKIGQERISNDENVSFSKTNTFTMNGADGKDFDSVMIPQSFPQDELLRFLKAIEGSKHNQIMLIETLRIEFPNIKKKDISEMIKRAAMRNGKRDTDEWIIRPAFKTYALNINGEQLKESTTVQSQASLKLPVAQRAGDV